MLACMRVREGAGEGEGGEAEREGEGEGDGQGERRACGCRAASVRQTCCERAAVTLAAATRQMRRPAAGRLQTRQ